MRKVINNAVYDTGKAKPICGWKTPNGGEWEALYLTKFGKYFLHSSGPQALRFLTPSRRNGRETIELIAPLTYSAAEQWAKRYATEEEYADAFGPGDPNAPAKINLTISAESKRKLDKLCQEHGITQGGMLNLMIAAYVLPEGGIRE